jgi:ribonuclease T2
MRPFQGLILAAAGLLATDLLIAAPVSDAAAQRAQSVNTQRHIPGKFDYYQLVLSWSPTHCAENSRGADDTQCGPRRKRPYGFVIHGLWPQYDGRGWPEFCATRGRPYVPNGIINSMMDIMPSRGLIIHQFKKHGTCTGMNPETYFKATRIAFNNVKIPKELANPERDQMMTPRELVNKFLSINPTLTADAVQVVCKRGNANRLKEVKVCMTRKGRFRPCQSGRPTRHRCANKKMHIPKARG